MGVIRVPLEPLPPAARTSEHFSHVDVGLGHVSDTKVDQIQLALMLRIICVQDVQERLHRTVHVTCGSELGQWVMSQWEEPNGSKYL